MARRRSHRRGRGYGALSGVVGGMAGIVPMVPDSLLFLGLVGGAYWLWSKSKPVTPNQVTMQTITPAPSAMLAGYGVITNDGEFGWR